MVKRIIKERNQVFAPELRIRQVLTEKKVFLLNQSVLLSRKKPEEHLAHCNKRVSQVFSAQCRKKYLFTANWFFIALYNRYSYLLLINVR